MAIYIAFIGRPLPITLLLYMGDITEDKLTSTDISSDDWRRCAVVISKLTHSSKLGRTTSSSASGSIGATGRATTISDSSSVSTVWQLDCAYSDLKDDLIEDSIVAKISEIGQGNSSSNNHVSSCRAWHLLANAS